METTKPARLLNPHADCPFTGRVMADVDIACYQYFFGRPVTKADPAPGPGLFVGTRGARQALISQFLERLKAECLAQGLRPEWDPENEVRVQEIMNQMNFKPKGKRK